MGLRLLACSSWPGQNINWEVLGSCATKRTSIVSRSCTAYLSSALACRTQARNCLTRPSLFDSMYSERRWRQNGHMPGSKSKLLVALQRRERVPNRAMFRRAGAESINDAPKPPSPPFPISFPSHHLPTASLARLPLKNNCSISRSARLLRLSRTTPSSLARQSDAS